MLKTQQRSKCERHSVFIEKTNKIALSSNDDKRMLPIDSKKAYAYGTSKDLLCKKEKIKRKNIIKQFKTL